MTDLLSSWMAGDRDAGDRLFDALYLDLRAVARRRLRPRRGGTLDTTALIHEAYLRLVDGSRLQVRGRGHFLALASRVMRQIVVDTLRRKGAAKRGGGVVLASFDPAVPEPIGRAPEDLIALDEALRELEGLDPRLASLVDLRFFGGLSVEETAGALGVSVATFHRDWLKARAFLLGRLRSGPA